MGLFLELVDEKVLRILVVLLNSPKEHFHIQKLSRMARVPLSSTHRLVTKLVKKKIIQVIRIDKFKIYCLQNEKVEELKSLVKK